MTTIETIIKRYEDRSTAPLTIRECAALHGVKWTKEKAQVEEFSKRFVICRDGIIRKRISAISLTTREDKL